MSKSFFTQVKSFEVDLIAVGLNPQEKEPIKRLLEENQKIIQSLKKRLKIPITDHPQTEEMMVLQKERDHFHDEVLNLKAMVLKLREEKEQLHHEERIIPGSKGIQQTATDELTKEMSQVSLKDGEIKELKGKNSKLQQENRNLQKEEKDLEDKISKHNEKMKGKLQLQGTKHMIWDEILVEVTKMWDFLNMVEDKRVLVRTTLVKHETTNELMQRRPTERAQKTVNFLSNVSNQDLITMKIYDRLGIIMRDKKFIEMQMLMNKVKVAC